MPIKHVYLDMDGVLVDFHHAFQLLCGIADPLQGHEWSPHQTLADHCCRSMADCRKLAAAAPESFWRTMPETQYGIMIAEACSQFAEAQGASLSILTDTSDSPRAAIGKLGWLYDHIPKFAANFIGTNNKSQFANSESLLIDDTHEVAEQFYKAGGHAIVLPQAWNNWKLPYGAPRTPKIRGLLALAARCAGNHSQRFLFFISDAKGFRLYDRD
jgi:hypothetical protein